jgi:hypothetical protein
MGVGAWVAASCERLFDVVIDVLALQTGLKDGKTPSELD